MKRLITFSVLVFMALFQLRAAVYTVTSSGMTFAPNDLNINSGDTVIFNLASNHNAVEVSQSTWNANGSTASGGFSVPYGGGMVILQSTGTHYYVCTQHASFGMKGKIQVTNVTGFSNIKLDKDVIISPNPVKDHFTVSIRDCNEEAGTVEIWDMSGNLVTHIQKMDVPGDKCSIQINVADLPSGMYIIEMKQKGERYAKKFAKQ